jgi:hypothetical protein
MQGHSLGCHTSATTTPPDAQDGALLRDAFIQKVQHYTGLRSLADMEIKDSSLRIAMAHQDAIGWHNFLLRQKARQLERIQQDYISVTQQ